MKKIFLNNSAFLEGVCELADQRVREKFGDSGYVIEEEESSYTEEAQDYFNEVYDEIETTLNKVLNIYSEEDVDNTVLSTLSESTLRKLEDAQDKITLDILDKLEYGEEVRLNDLIVLYKYSSEDVVVLNLATDDEWEEILQLQWDDEGNIEYEAL